MTSNAAVSSKLSIRARTLSQRRRNNLRAQHGEGLDLSGQDAPLNDRDFWDEKEEDEEEEEVDDVHSHSALGSEVGLDGQQRGRTHEAVAA